MVKYKRQMPQSTKDKISAKLKGRKRPNDVKEKISQSLKKVWSQVPQTTTSNFWSVNRENNENNTNLNDESK